MSTLSGLVVGVDQDEVLHHWNRTFHADAREDYPHIDFPFLTNGNRSWDLMDGLDDEGRKAVRALMDKPGFYRRLNPIDGAREALEEMEAEGIHVVIVTSPTLSNPTCASDKHHSLERDYGTKWAKRAIITDDKTLVDLDFLIDDKPEITGHKENPRWDQIVFDQPYNQHVTDKIRLKSWSDWRFALESAIYNKALNTAKLFSS